MSLASCTFPGTLPRVAGWGPTRGAEPVTSCDSMHLTVKVNFMLRYSQTLARFLRKCLCNNPFSSWFGDKVHPSSHLFPTVDYQTGGKGWLPTARVKFWSGCVTFNFMRGNCIRCSAELITQDSRHHLYATGLPGCIPSDLLAVHQTSCLNAPSNFLAEPSDFWLCHLTFWLCYQTFRVCK